MHDSRLSLSYTKHAAALVLAIAFAAEAIAAFTVLNRIARLTLDATTTVTFVLWWRHEATSFCLWCIRDGADRGAITNRWQHAALWFHHYASRRWYVYPGATLLAAISIASSGLLAAAPFAILSVYLCCDVQAYRTHQRLIVWCPWCQDGGDPERDVEPTPDPASTKTA